MGDMVTGLRRRAAVGPVQDLPGPVAQEMLPANFGKGCLNACVFGSHHRHDLLGVGTANDRQFCITSSLLAVMKIECQA